MRTPPLGTPLEDAVVYPVRTEDDRTALWQWLQHEPVLAFDTETEGLDFHDGARLVQLATAREAWVLDPHEHPDVIEELTYGGLSLIAHNAAFDAAVLGHLLMGDSDDHLAGHVMNVMGLTTDTSILAHLVDPRSQQDGGLGHGLKPLADHYLGAGAIDGQAALKARFRELGLTMVTGWRHIALEDETYLRYAGIDPILTFRLHDALAPKIVELGLEALSKFEHEVATICAGMTARGIRVDRDHTRSTLAHLTGEQATAESTARTMGVENIHAPQQIAEALLVRGVELTEKTATGKWSMDKTVLDGIDDPLARVVQKAKAAGKAATTYVRPILDQSIVDGRVHCRIRPLGARTGRMSVSDPPLQQLPTDDWRVRRCLIADPNQSIVAVDYGQIEVRVMAYLASEGALIEAFGQGLDIHDTVAARLYGAGFSSGQRRLAKSAVFAKLYGASAKRLAIQTGVTDVAAKQTMTALDRAYPRLARWSRTTIDRAKFHGGVATTPSGRRLPTQRGREFTLVNHLCQATAADIFKSALIEVHRAGHGDRLLLPIHDELLLQCDEQVAEEFGMVIADLMAAHLGDVPLVAEAKVCGPSWGHAYQPMEALSA